MKLDVNVIENDIYTKVCSDFTEYAQKKLHRYKTVFEFLRKTDIKNIITPTTLKVYDQYQVFCKHSGYEPLAHTIFSRTLCECGFFVKRKQESKTKKMLSFFVQR